MPTSPRGQSSLKAATAIILSALLCVTALVALGKSPDVVVGLIGAIVAPSLVALMGVVKAEGLHADLHGGLLREKLGEAVVEQSVAGNLLATDTTAPTPDPSAPGGSG